MLTEDPVLTLVAAALHGRLCESCRQRRARLVVSWPDAQFEVCMQCVPAPLLAANTTRTARDQPAASWWRRALPWPLRLPAHSHLPAARTARHG